MVKLIGQKAMNRVVSHQPEVVDRVASEARERGNEAEGALARHRKEGQASISVTHGDVDSFINLDDPEALSIEFGHMVKGKYERETPKYVPGLYIITGAAGLISGPKLGPSRG